MFFAARRVAWSNLAPWSKDIKEQEFWPLDIDEQLLKERIKGLTPIKVWIDGVEQ